jgi:hypothetical protein
MQHALPLQVKNKDWPVNAGVVVQSHSIGQRHGAWQVLQAARVAASHILFRYVMAANKNTVLNTPQVGFDSADADEMYNNLKPMCSCVTHQT